MKQIKQISIWLIALVGLMTVTNAVQADDYSFKYNGLYYKITASGPLPLRHYVKVVPEKAGYPYYSDANKPKGAVVVPEKFTRKVGIDPLSPSHTYIVTEIGEYAFYGCKGLTSVSIPTVQVIGNEAFRECSWMTSVRISGNALRKIGDAAFAGCDHLASINIPDGVTTIGGGVFDLCGSLKELDIPASVKTMGDNLIEDCDELKTIKVHWTKPISVPKNAFSGQERYITLKVPAGTEAAYRAAPVWKNFKIDAGSMLYYDFTYNKLHYKITGSGSHFFHDYVKVVPEKAGMFNYSEGKRPTGNVTIPEKFAKNAGIGSLPSYIYTVTEIGDYAFYNCKGLTSVSIPNTVQTIGNHTFSLCKGLTSVSIPNGVKKIGRFAFASCDALKIVDIPSSVNEFGFRAFDFCKGLKTVTVHWDNPPVVPSDLFNGIDTKKVTLEVPKGKKDVYRAASVWKDFKIDETTANETVDGLRVYAAGGALRLTLPKAETVHLYHVNGAMVKTLVLPAGDHVQPLPSGVYLVRVGEQVTKILIK